VIKLPTSHGLNCHGRDSYKTKIRKLSAITVTLNFFIFCTFCREHMVTVTLMWKNIMKKSITVTVSKCCMRIPAIYSDFKGVICHAIGQKGHYGPWDLIWLKNMILMDLSVTLGQKGQYGPWDLIWLKNMILRHLSVTL